jgi:hypothetical protein
MTDTEIVITAASPMLALEQLLSDAVQSPVHRPDPEKRYLLGFNVEAGDLTTLMTHAIEEIHALAAEQGASVVACEVSGFHETGEAHRLWGTIECTIAAEHAAMSTRVDHVAIEMVAPGQWRLTAHWRKEDQE